MTHPLATALAWIGSVYVTMVIAITVLFVGSEIAARVKQVKRGRSPAAPTTTEPDPIESYASAGPRCIVCGKTASTRDIDGDWWPPCVHAKQLGMQVLRYDLTLPVPLQSDWHF